MSNPQSVNFSYYQLFGYVSCIALSNLNSTHVLQLFRDHIEVREQKRFKLLLTFLKLLVTNPQCDQIGQLFCPILKSKQLLLLLSMPDKRLPIDVLQFPILHCIYHKLLPTLTQNSHKTLFNLLSYYFAPRCNSIFTPISPENHFSFFEGGATVLTFCALFKRIRTFLIHKHNNTSAIFTILCIFYQRV